MKNIEKLKSKEGKLFLNVASSFYLLENFVNLDNHIFLRFIHYPKLFKFIVPSKYHERFLKYSDGKKDAILVKHDCRKPLPFPENSVDHILCSHFLEHVYPNEMEKIVKDFKRALKKGGTLHIIVPDIAVAIETYLTRKKSGEELAADNFIHDTLLSKKDRGSLKYRILEFHGGFGLQHYWMYDNESMVYKIKKMGFKILNTNDTPSKTIRENDDSVHIICKKE
ncbi:MAG: hypothetical protein COA97_06680 [Flavobacteriales bacterium]|nr:MAG: hypothetical protein COA97_06680 [Flavobacteriales bacterium]